MTTLREAAQMALEAMEQVQEADTAGATPKMVMEARKLYEPTITALRAALAQPEQEPPCETGSQCVGNKCERCAVQEREWQGLTDEEMMMIYGQSHEGKKYSLGRAIEAKLKEKNGL